MLHVVFHMQLRLQKPDVKEWWISVCNKKTMQDGYETMKVQVNHIFQEYLQNLVGELELRSDGVERSIIGQYLGWRKLSLQRQKHQLRMRH